MNDNDYYDKIESSLDAMVGLGARAKHLGRMIRVYFPIVGQTWIYENIEGIWDPIGIVADAFDDFESLINPERIPFDNPERRKRISFPLHIVHHDREFAIDVLMIHYDRLLSHYNIQKEISSAIAECPGRDAQANYLAFSWWHPSDIVPVTLQELDDFDLATDGLQEAIRQTPRHHPGENSPGEVWLSYAEAAKRSKYDEGHISRLVTTGMLQSRKNKNRVEIAESSLRDHLYYRGQKVRNRGK